MATHSLPPRGVFVPTHLIFHPELPAAVLVTWIQLRCLAWDGWIAPPLSLSELAAHIGIHPSRLNKHLAQLKEIAALSWRIAGQGKLVLSFPVEPNAMPGRIHQRNHLPPATLPHEDQLSPMPTSYFPPKILGYLSFDDDDEGFLYADRNSEVLEGARTEPVVDISSMIDCSPKEHAYLSK